MMVSVMGEQSTRSRGDEERGRYCLTCAYDLRGLLASTTRCPECGRAFDSANPCTFRRRPFRTWGRLIKRVAIGLTTMLVVLVVVWGYFFWGWYSERQVLIALKVEMDGRYGVAYTPFVTSWPKKHLGPIGVVMDRVTFIDLGGRAELTNLAPLARLRNLQIVGLGNVGATDLEPLSSLTKLEALQLDGMRVKALAPLGGLTSLKSIGFNNTDVDDLAPLVGLTNLEHLECGNSAIGDLAPLAGLTHLQELGLKGTRVTDLTPLASLTNLTDLDLSNTSVKEVSPLAGLARLNRLVLANTLVTDLTPLSGLKSLRWLIVSKTGISEAQVTALQQRLPDCKIIRE